jgi:hypothetical protein
MLTMPDFIVPKRFLGFGSQFLTPSTSSSLFVRSGPSDFWLFEYLKGVLQGSSFDEPDDFLSAIQKILREIICETLNAVFEEWMIRLQKCIDG